MNRFIALIETETDPVANPDTLVVSKATAIPQIDAETFIYHWNAGVLATQQWEQFCENLFQILTKSGLIDENGLHIAEYTPGSICRFLLTNKELFPADFRDSALGMMVMSAIKTGAKTIKKGKEIVINWADITAHAAPMTEAVLTHLMKSPERAAMMMPIVRQYFSTAAQTMENPSSPASSDPQAL